MWDVGQSTPSAAWSQPGRSALGLTASSGEVMWLDGAGNAVPGYTDITARWAPEGPVLTPTTAHGVQLYSQIVGDAERLAKGTQAGFETIDRASGVSTETELANAVALPFMGKTAMSTKTEIWVETIGSVHRYEVE